MYLFGYYCIFKSCIIDGSTDPTTNSGTTNHGFSQIFQPIHNKTITNTLRRLVRLVQFVKKGVIRICRFGIGCQHVTDKKKPYRHHKDSESSEDPFASYVPTILRGKTARASRKRDSGSRIDWKIRENWKNQLWIQS